MSRRPRPQQKGPVAGPASMIRVGRSPHYAAANHWPVRVRSGVPVELGSPVSWYDAHDGAGLQSVPSRVGSGVMVLGTGTGSDSSDPTFTAGPPPRWSLDGTDDYLQLPAGDKPTTTATTGGHTVILILRPDAAFATTNNRIYSSEGSANNGYQLRALNTTGPRAYFTVAGGTTNVSTPGGTTFTAGTIIGCGIVHDNGSARMIDKAKGGSVAITTAASTTGVGTINHGNPRIGVAGYTVGAPTASNVLAVVTYNTALSNAQVETAMNYLFGTF